jgi:hypothetical protein
LIPPMQSTSDGIECVIGLKSRSAQNDEQAKNDAFQLRA